MWPTRIKDIGFKYATRSGYSHRRLGHHRPAEKEEIIDAALEESRRSCSAISAAAC